jgi:hypothetical protein
MNTKEIKKLIRESIEEEDKISAQGIMEEDSQEAEPKEDSVGEIAPIDNLPPQNNPTSHYGESEEKEDMNESLRLKYLSGIISENVYKELSK